jgi:tetratricopeptide (TPR) repeat protein
MCTLAHCISRQQAGMAMTILSQTIQWNNQGATRSLSGQHEGAIQILSRALALSRQIIGDRNTQEVSLASSDLITGEEAKFSLDDFMRSNSAPQAANEVDEGIGAERRCEESRNRAGTCAYLYLRAIHIETDSLVGRQGLDSNVAVSFIIVFNLALAHHRFALDQGDKVQLLLLQKAALLYELSFKLFHETNLDSVMFIMFCANNLGLIYQQLGENDKADHCFQRVLQTIVFMVDYRKECADDVFLDGLLQNAATQIWHETTAAAA